MAVYDGNSEVFHLVPLGDMISKLTDCFPIYSSFQLLRVGIEKPKRTKTKSHYRYGYFGQFMLLFIQGYTLSINTSLPVIITISLVIKYSRLAAPYSSLENQVNNFQVVFVSTLVFNVSLFHITILSNNFPSIETIFYRLIHLYTITLIL